MKKQNKGKNKLEKSSHPLSISPSGRGRSRVLKFPPGFLWGTATAAYQIEGGIQNDWETQSRLAQAGKACDHYNRYQEDFLIAKKLHNNAIRISLEWSRIEPEEGVWNEEALEHYFHVLDFLKEKGFTIFLTLHHFTNPIWFARSGGWTNKKSGAKFAAFTDKVVEHLGELVDFWVTINEPNVYANMGFLRGMWPPFTANLWQAYRVYKNMLDAHNRAYTVIHAYYPDAKVGLAQNISANEPYNPRSFLDRKLAQFNDWIKTNYPYSKTKNDFIGLNYYFRNRMHAGLDSSAAADGNEKGAREKIPQERLTDKGWEIYPEGLYRVLVGLKKFRKPIYITENGLADARDAKRADFIVNHLKAVHRAIARGTPVKGYLHWTLLDSYEWPVLENEKTGFEMKFGLVEVDFAGDLKRKIRKSAKSYARICQKNALSL
ncbi:MAG: glycoside hydrolase family 1 protein [bacterium]|nr:glycoside hydrolase family 1 protein [bacterium]